MSFLDLLVLFCNVLINHTRIARLTENKDIDIDYKNTKKLANFGDLNYAHCQESTDILNNNLNKNRTLQNRQEMTTVIERGMHVHRGIPAIFLL